MQTLLWFAVNAVIFLLTYKKPPSQNVEAGNFDASSYPESKDKPIASVFGKALVRAPNTIWAGGERSEPVRQKQDVGFMGKLLGMGGSQTVAHRYYTSMDLALAFGRADLVSIYEDEKKIFSTSQIGSISSGVMGEFIQRQRLGIVNNSVSHTLNGQRIVPIDAFDIEFFNVRDNGSSYTYSIRYKLMEEDGAMGEFQYFDGSNSQSPPAMLRQRVSEHYPAYKGLAHIVLNDMYVGQQPIPKKLSFELAHYSPHTSVFYNQENENIDGDANPAYVIFELMASPRYSNIPVSLIDIASIEEVANVCKSEGLGISFVWSQQGTIDDLITKICDHCDITRRENHETGKIELVAIRPDYNIDDLFTFDDSNIHAVSDYSKPSLDALNTQIQVKYTDRDSKYNEKHVKSHNIGLVNNQIQQNQVSKDYTFFTKASLAQWAADRDLVSMTNDISTVKIVSNRDAAVLNIGDAVKVKLPVFDDFYKVYRIQSIDLGSLENNKVTLDMVEDVFGRSPKLYAGITGEKEDPQEPSAPHAINVFEVPTGSITAFVDKPRVPGRHIGYQMNHGFGHGGVDERVTDFPDSYTDEVFLVDSINSDDVQFMLDGTFNTASFMISSSEERGQGANLALILNESTGEHEYISYAVGNAGQGTVQIVDVWRGLFDTIPMPHVAGSRVFLFSSANTEVPRQGGLSSGGITHRLTAIAATATSEDLSVSKTITQTDRYARPNTPIDAAAANNLDDKLTVTYQRRPASYGTVVPNDQLTPSGWVRISVYDADLSGGIILPITVATVQTDSFTWEGDNGTKNLRIEVQGWDPSTNRASYYKTTLYHSR